MKRILLTILTLFVFTGLAHAAGSCSSSGPHHTYLGGARTSVVYFLVNCTADAADGSYPTEEIEGTGGMLTAFEIIPGGTAPTTLFDITLLNEDSHDVLGGNGSNIVTTTTTKRPPLDSDSNSFPGEIHGPLTQTPTGNSENSATFKAKYYFIP